MPTPYAQNTQNRAARLQRAPWLQSSRADPVDDQPDPAAGQPNPNPNAFAGLHGLAAQETMTIYQGLNAKGKGIFDVRTWGRAALRERSRAPFDPEGNDAYLRECARQREKEQRYQLRGEAKRAVAAASRAAFRAEPGA